MISKSFKSWNILPTAIKSGKDHWFAWTFPHIKHLQRKFILSYHVVEKNKSKPSTWFFF